MHFIGNLIFFSLSLFNPALHNMVDPPPKKNKDDIAF